MIRLRFISLLTALVLNGSLLLLAQPVSRYNTFSYNVNEGLLQTTIGDMAFDQNNFCWLSFPNGIQKFDGKNFTTVPVQPGLPDDKLCRLFQCNNGSLLISHSQGISNYNISANRFIEVFTFAGNKKGVVQFIGEDDGIVYFYTQTATIVGIDAQTFKVVAETKTSFTDYSSNASYLPRISKSIVNHKAAFLINGFLYLWDLKRGKLLHQSSAISGTPGYMLVLKNEDEVLYNTYTSTSTVQLYNFKSNITKPLLIKGVDTRYILRCNVYTWQNKVLFSVNDRIYETDTTLQTIKSELVNFQNQPVSENSAIAHIKEDNFGNLYFQTVTGGIKKIIRNNYPIKYYNTGKTGENFILSILPDKKNNKILLGSSGSGLLVFDTLQQLAKRINIITESGKPGSPNVILKQENTGYLFLLTGQKKLWQTNSELSNLSSIPFSTVLPENESGASYFGNPLFQTSKEAVIQSQHKLLHINFITSTVTEHKITEGYIMSGLHYSPYIITHVNDELIFLNDATFKEIKKISFKNTAYVRCFEKDRTNNIYIGSNKGIFKTDSTGKILQQWNKENGLPDECIYAMAFDDEGLLWCSTNKGILKINKDNSILQLKKEDGLQENEFNTNAVAKADDGELFFGGVNGVSSFFPKDIRRFDEKINLLFTQIKVNNEPAIKDTAMWAIDKIVLPYQKGSLSFDFIAMATGNPEQYVYQYKMKGLDKEWIQNSGTQTVRYFLQPGTYTFQIYASRQFDANAKPLKEIVIIIKPPFWQTWWFIAIAALAFISLLAYFINQNNKKKYAKKLQELENERQLKSERERISKDLHDNLGAYANAVLYNIELLEKEKTEEKRNELIGDLKFASKDIITSLRETVWALKKETYTAEECFVRIRNFIQPLTRYYSHIHFKTEGVASPDMGLPYTKALNIVRIVQEAVSNSIKHATPDNIVITSFFTNNKWSIKVADDGKGFDYIATKQLEQGNGLNNMQQRAAESGFDFKTESSENKGTTITIII